MHGIDSPGHTRRSVDAGPRWSAAKPLARSAGLRASMLLLSIIVAVPTDPHGHGSGPIPSALDWVDPLIGTGGHMYGVGGGSSGSTGALWSGQVLSGVNFSCTAHELSFLSDQDTTPVRPELWLDFEHYGGANYEDHYIHAFSVLHMVGPGALDLGTLGVMPIGAADKAVDVNGMKAPFKHAAEHARPGHYSVRLTPAGSAQPLLVELTTTSHVAAMRLTAQETENSEQVSVLIDLRHTLSKNGAKNCSVTLDASAGTITGHMIDQGGLSGRSASTVSGQGGLDLWFHAIFPKQTLESSCSGVVQNGEVFTAESSEQQPLLAKGNASAFACVNNADTIHPLVVMIGISTISAFHAKANIVAEVGDREFDELVAAAEEQWTERMSVIELIPDDDSPEHHGSLLTPFWTAVYHTMMGVSTYSEAGGSYIGFDGVNSFGTLQTLQKTTPPDRQLSDMSIWDTHRSWNPLMVLTQPDIATAVVRSLARMYQQGGSVPRWPLAHGYTGCMIGNHAGQVVLDTWTKGIRNFDVELLWEGLQQQAQFTNNTGVNRIDLANYVAHGHCISDPGAPAAKYAASCTLAYAYDDWALAELSAALHKPSAIVSDFLNRSKSYRNTWDDQIKFFCPRLSNGTFQCPRAQELAPEGFIARAAFGGDKINGYVEGDAWQWRWFVPGDVAGLVELFGGNESFNAELERFFIKSADARYSTTDVPNPFYWAGNEPGILAPWLFALTGRPDLTAKYTRWVLETYFTTAPNGIPGNDDFATMSAWAVWAWLGFYPLTGTDTYMLGSPRFAHVRIKPFGKHNVSIDVYAHVFGDMVFGLSYWRRTGTSSGV